MNLYQISEKMLISGEKIFTFVIQSTANKDMMSDFWAYESEIITTKPVGMTKNYESLVDLILRSCLFEDHYQAEANGSSTHKPANFKQ